MKMTFSLALFTVLFTGISTLQAATPRIEKVSGQEPRNIIFVLTDDHRYDAMGFVGHPWLETPQMDRMAANGAHFPNAFVTTSLCAPSRASIITGLYAHNHQVIDNYNPVRSDLMYFPQYLQSAGYETAFVGKWHMGGDVDDPQRGFDHWVSLQRTGHLLGRWERNLARRSADPSRWFQRERKTRSAEGLHHRRNHRLCIGLAH